MAIKMANRISDIDLDSVDRSTELLGITPASTVRFSVSTDSSNYLEYSVDAAPVAQIGYVQ